MKILTIVIGIGLILLLSLSTMILSRRNQVLDQVNKIDEAYQQPTTLLGAKGIYQEEPSPTQSPTPFPTEPFVQFSYTPVPTPNMIAGPELETIAFTNFRALKLPSKTHAYFYDSSWSPNSNLFAGYHAPWMEGQDIVDLYVGKVDTGEFYRFKENAAWPIWSYRGEYLYFLMPRQDGTIFKYDESRERPYYDFYRKSSMTGEENLVIQNVEPFYAPPIQFSELPNGNLLTWNTKHQLIVLPDADTLVKAPTELDQITPVAILAEFSQPSQPETVTNDLLPSFLVSNKGNVLLLVDPQNSSKIIDLSSYTTVDEFDGPEVAGNVAWSSDDSLIAYTAVSGLYVYDTALHSTLQLVQKQDLGFREDDLRSGISQPVWLKDDRSLLFTGVSPDWLTQNPGDWHVGYFTFAVTKDGKQVKSIGAFSVDSVSPDKNHAIIRKQELDSGYFGAYLVDIMQ